MCIHLTPVLYCNTTVLIEVYLLCLTDSVSLRDIGKPTSREELSSLAFSYFKAVQGSHIGSALTVANSELTDSNFAKRTHTKHIILYWEKDLELVYIIFYSFYTSNLENGEHNPWK